MKDSFYFQHDYNSRNDEKIIKLVQIKGSAGYGNYWMLVEMLYEAGGVMRLDYDCIAFALRTHCDEIKALINDFGLFDVDGTSFTSKRVQENLETRRKLSENGRESALKRWKTCQPNANPMPKQCQPNARKERKGKEMKGNEIKENKDLCEVFSHLKNTEFNKTYQDYLNMRKKIRKPATERAEKLVLKKLHEYPIQIAIKMLEKSIVSSWQDVYEIKQSNWTNEAEKL